MQKDLPQTKIAIIDGVKLKRTASCFKTHEKIISDMLNEAMSKARKYEHQMKTAYEKINSDKKLSQKQKLKNKAKAETEYANFTIKHQEEIQNIRNMNLKLSEHLIKKLDKVIKDISKAKKINIVLNSQTKDSIIVFYNSQNVDITDLVIQKLDELVPDVKPEDVK